MSRRLPAALLLVFLVAATAFPRVVSYAPYTDRVSVPAVGFRFNRHFALVETTSNQFSGYGVSRGQIVLYDSKGIEEPRVIFPQDSSEMLFDGVAVREPLDEPVMILAVASSSSQAWNLSVDSGRTWKKLAINGRLSGVSSSSPADVGGFFARSRYSSLRVGNRDYPFVAVTVASDGYRLLAIDANGTPKELLSTPANMPISLAGSDADRRRFLVRVGSGISGISDIGIIDTNGSRSLAGTITGGGSLEGWVTPSGAAYVEQWKASNDITLWIYTNGTRQFVAGTYDPTNPTATLPPPSTVTQNPFFAVPTADFSGAWIVKRAANAPTQLFSHSPQRSLVEQWSDVTAPEVEAIHPALSGTKVLIQVHRQRRAADQILFKDPALAIWHVGEPAPRAYDELYLAEASDKGFVHLDVDALENGEPFAFDGGRVVTPGCQCGISSGGGGGGDVVQEWGVVRGSLSQRLVLPGFGRTQGAFGSLWRSDLTFDNPNATAVNVTLRFIAAGDSVTTSASKIVRLQLAAREMRLVADAAKSLFDIEGGTGSLFIEPEGRASINVTGRTYTQSSKGTFGYGMNAIDVYSAASARFPVTFSGAFQGSNFRTNLFMTDVSGRGMAATFGVSGPTGVMQINAIGAETTALGVLQRNSLGFLLGLSPQTVGALSVQPTRGEAVAAVFSIDNRTNDSTFFPPDLSVGTARTIPVVGHLDGANGSQFRSDLFLYNQSSQYKTVGIEMRSWTSPGDTVFMNVTLFPREARMFPDVLKITFNRTGQARLRIGLQGSTLDTSVRVTSRTYTVDANGGTYGFIMPPLNSFQMATTGDTLEILGTALDSRFRTNIGLVDVAGSLSSPGPRARIEIIGSNEERLDSFETSFLSTGGTQLNDVFRGRALTHDGRPVKIRITPLQGMIGAYAAMVDNESNDPMYFAANLDAK